MNRLVKILVPLLLTSLSGCAVLQIDVDVYKGPLASHDDVLSQRVAASVIGIQSDLLRLREQILKKPRSEIENDCNDRTKQKFRELDQRIILACEVDALLVLFEDAGDQELALYRQRAIDAVEKITKALAIFDAQHPCVATSQDDPVSAISAEHLERERKVNKLLKVARRKLSGDAEKVALIDAYIQYLELDKAVGGCRTQASGSSRWREWSNIVNAALNLSGSTKSVQNSLDLFSAASRNPATTSNRGYREFYGANAAFETLANVPLLEEHSKLIFGDKKKEAELFVSTVFETSDSFRLAREGYEEAFVAGLLSISRLSVYAQQNPAVLLRYDSLPERLAGSVSLGTHIQHLACALLLIDQDPYGIYERLGRDIGGSIAEKCAQRPENFEPAQKALSRRLQLHPRETSNALLTLHQLFKSASQNATEQAGFPNRLVLSNRRKYGLLVGPDENGDELKKLNVLTNELQTTASALADLSLFGRGRLPTGIWSLVEGFVEAADRAAQGRTECFKDVCSDAVVERRIAAERLENGLVRFAEKVLSLANSSHEFQVFEAPPGPRQIRTKGENKLYAIVLQRIGNTILAVADEMAAKRDYENAQRAQLDREVAAIKQAFGGNSSEYYSRFRAVAASERERLAGVAQEAAAALKTLKEQRSAANTTRMQRLKACNALEPRMRGTLQAALTTSSLPALTLCNEDASKQTDLSSLNLKGKSDTWLPVYTNALATLAANSNNQIRKTAIEAADASGSAPMLSDHYDPIVKAINAIAEPNDENQKKRLNDVKSALGTSGFAQAVLDKLENEDFPANGLRAPHILDRGILPVLTDRQNSLQEERYTKLIADIEQYRLQIKEQSDLLTELDVRIETATKADTKAKTESNIAAAALNEIDQRRGRVLERLGGKAEDAVSPIEVLLETLRATPPASNASKILQHVSQLPRPLEAPRSLATSKSRTSKEALDELIAALRIQQVRAISEQGRDSNQAKYIKEALDAAYRQRSDQIYIRPAITYLRTSFASSSLGDNGIRWRNLLDNQVVRTVPIIGAINENTPFNGTGINDRLLQIVERNDTQFWQNVNQVRVSGGGQANFVVVKDDIGNWYVRRYDSDSDRIFESLRNVALFSAGAPGSSLTPSDGPNGQPATATVTTPLERVYLERNKDYQSSVQQHYESLQGRLAATGTRNLIVQSVRTAWLADPNLTLVDEEDSSMREIRSELQNLPATGTVALNDAAEAMAERIAETEQIIRRDELNEEDAAAALLTAREEAILTGLRAINTYHENLRQGVAGANISNEDMMSDARKTSAQTGLRTVLGGLVTRETQRHLDNINKFRDTAIILSDAVSTE